MTEDESNRWEQQLPKPEKLIALSQTLITPDLAIAFDIWNPHNPYNHHHHQQPPAVSTPSSQPNSGKLDSSELGGDEPARTLKRPRLVWTPQLHKRFVDAVAQLGIKNAVPKTIMQLMNADGLTRENVASHLQKYRLYLKRMQGLSSGNGGGGFGSAGVGELAGATAFASSVSSEFRSFVSVYAGGCASTAASPPAEGGRRRPSPPPAFWVDPFGQTTESAVCNREKSFELVPSWG